MIRLICPEKIGFLGWQLPEELGRIGLLLSLTELTALRFLII